MRFYNAQNEERTIHALCEIKSDKSDKINEAQVKPHEFHW